MYIWLGGWVGSGDTRRIRIRIRGGILVAPAAFLRVELGPDLLRQIYGGGDDLISGALIGILSVLSVLLRVLTSLLSGLTSCPSPLTS